MSANYLGWRDCTVFEVGPRRTCPAQMQSPLKGGVPWYLACYGRHLYYYTSVQDYLYVSSFKFLADRLVTHTCIDMISWLVAKILEV
jgi:hypothetical protein